VAVVLVKEATEEVVQRVVDMAEFVADVEKRR